MQMQQEMYEQQVQSIIQNEEQLSHQRNHFNESLTEHRQQAQAEHFWLPKFV